MSLYEQLIQEGREEGRREVMSRAVKALQKLNMDAVAIAAALELPVEEVKQYLA